MIFWDQDCNTDKIPQKANIILFAVWILGNDDASIFCSQLVACWGSGLGLWYNNFTILPNA